MTLGVRSLDLDTATPQRQADAHRLGGIAAFEPDLMVERKREGTYRGRVLPLVARLPRLCTSSSRRMPSHATRDGWSKRVPLREEFRLEIARTKNLSLLMLTIPLKGRI